MANEPLLIVDSTVWIGYFRGRQTVQTEWLNWVVGQREICMIDLILCEVLQGALHEGESQYLLENLQEFALLKTGGENLAIVSAQNYRALRRQGITIRKTIDCLIATICITHGYDLLHNDKDFDPFEQHLGLQVIHSQLH